MFHILNKTRKGFTLVEIMIVVAIIALLAAIAVPNFLRARKRSQATRILEDLRLLDSANDQYAIETNKITGMNPSFGDLKNYIKTGTVLYTTGADLFGNTYGPFTIDSIPVVNAAQFNALSDVCPVGFWSPFAVAPY
jgi:prepilin-type N-terminal cleavage/methylation domain-containing protein